MPGLVIVGTAAGAAELAVAAATCLSLREDGRELSALAVAPTGAAAASEARLLARAARQPLDTVAPLVLEPAATPWIAAGHAGKTLDPGAFAERALRAAGERTLVVATCGGLLAPLARRYTVRDLARELALPLVVAVPAGPDLVNHALLSVEAATGVALAIAAIVVTCWPESPARVLLDERALLGDQAPAPVVALPALAAGDEGALADAARGWRAADWLEPSAAAAAAQAGAAPPARVTLEPYRAWEPRTVGDPRATPRPQIMDVMLEIVGAEGPMRASRAYALYNRAAGGRKLTAVARAPLSSAVYWLAREAQLVLTRAEEIPWQEDDLVRLPDTPPVLVRELGSRSLEEVPLDEIAELVRRLRRAHPDSDATAVKRAVLGAYGLVRLTARADEYLGLALDLADGG